MAASNEVRRSWCGDPTGGELKIDKCLIYWWARQDSNLQPDRHEREDIAHLVDVVAFSSVVECISLHFGAVVSGAKLVRQPIVRH
jgi:hypothetical protein